VLIYNTFAFDKNGLTQVFLQNSTLFIYVKYTKLVFYINVVPNNNTIYRGVIHCYYSWLTFVEIIKRRKMKLLKTLLTITAIATLTLASSCKKDNGPFYTTINGQVRTFGTEDPIKHPPVKIKLIERYYPGVGGYSWRTLDVTRTDSNGFYTLSYDLYKDLEYFLMVEEDQVKTSKGYIPPSNWWRADRKITQLGGTYTKHYYLSAYGWVKFHFISENPQPGDEFWYSVGGGV